MGQAPHCWTGPNLIHESDCVLTQVVTSFESSILTLTLINKGITEKVPQFITNPIYNKNFIFNEKNVFLYFEERLKLKLND